MKIVDVQHGGGGRGEGKSLVKSLLGRSKLALARRGATLLR
jgi:hypothetical protein